MKIFLSALLIIVGMSAAYATSSILLLHVGQSAGNGGGGSGACTGTIDASEGCPLPMIGM